jgi:RNA polymerase sigma-70 factor (ECF subfamily)
MARHLANEAELIAAAQAGNREAFGILMSSCYEPTFRLAIGIMRNREDAEDVLQDAMLKAYCNLKQFQGNSRFYTWIVRITINEALMKIRRRHGEKQVMLDEVIESERGFLRQEIEDWSNYPEKFYAQLELREILHDALTRLSPRLCAAFCLRNVEDLSVKETAAKLGLSTNGVKSRVSRARSRLRKRLRSVLHGSRGAPHTPRRALSRPLAGFDIPSKLDSALSGSARA